MNKLINKFCENAEKNNVNIDSIFVENSGGGIGRKILNNNIFLHELRSCSKLLIAFAIGIAIDENLKCKYEKEDLSLNTKVYSTFASIYNGNINEKVKQWTIKTLFNYTAGFDKFFLKAKELEKVDKNNLLEIIFNEEIKNEVGSKFVYNNVEPYLLSVFFKENFNINISDYINEKIFKKLNIKNYRWDNYGKYCAGATGLFLSHEDFHKIGELLFNFGNFNGEQIVPKSWVEKMTQPQVQCPDYYKPERVLPKLSAGYFTWISRDNIVFRDGANGQYIICDYKNKMLITILSTQKDMSKVTECLRGLI